MSYSVKKKGELKKLDRDTARLKSTGKIRVVRRVDEIVAEGLLHVVAEIELVGRHDQVVLAQEEPQESLGT